MYHPQAAAQELGLEFGKAVKLEQDSRLGYFLRVTRQNEKVLRTKRQFTTIETQKSGVKFTTHQLSAVNDAYTALKKTYDVQQEQVCDQTRCII